MDFGPEGMEKKKAWKDIWGCGQGINAIKSVLPTSELVAKLKREYDICKKDLLNNAA